jgi:hypothetical protein
LATGGKIGGSWDRSDPVGWDVVGNSVWIASGIVNLHASVVIVKGLASSIVVIDWLSEAASNVTVVRGKVAPATVITRSGDLLGHTGEDTSKTIPNVVKVSELRTTLAGVLGLGF